MSAELTEAQIRGQLIPALRKLHGQGTLGDIVAAASTPARKTANLLNRLLVEWGGTLAVDERGELLYKFPPNLSPPYDWEETWHAVTAAAYRAFKVAFKICIAVVLVVYFVVFLVIMIAMIVAAIAATSKDKDSKDSGFSFNRDGGFPNIFFFFTGSSNSYGAARRQTQWQRNAGISAYEGRSAAAGGANIYAVFNYVFGEEPPPVDPAAADRELLAYIREHKGVIAATDLVWLRGLRYDEAEKLATRLLVDYNGEPEVSEHGTILYRFTQVVRSAEKDANTLRGSQAWQNWWDMPESPAVLNQNSALTNGVITGFNIFNLGWSGWFSVVPGATDHVSRVFGLSTAPPGLDFLLGGFPLVFSLVFFAVPAIRWVQLNKENERREARNRQRQILKAIAQATQAGRAELPAGAGARADLAEAVLAYQGEMKIGEQGNVTYRFERPPRELADAQAARLAVKTADLELGHIVYDTARDVAEQ